MRYSITAQRNRRISRHLVLLDSVEPITLDYSGYANEFGDVTAVDWIIKSGQASIANQALSGNIATATISTPQLGSTLIQVKATAGSNIRIDYLETVAVEPYRASDYGLCYG
jgi:hypothetical protein